MSSLLDRSAGLTRSAAGDVPPSPWTAACLAAARAAGTGLLPVLVLVVTAWVLGAGGQATWSQAVRLAAGLWLLAHHTGLAVDGGHVGLVPLGLVVAPLVACWSAGRRLARSLDSRAERIEAGATRAAPAALAWQVLLGFVGAYCVLACVVSFAISMPGLRPVSGQALVGAAVVALTGGGLGAAAYRYSSTRRCLAVAVRRLPGLVRPCLPPALGALAVWIGAGAALVAVLLATHAHGVTGLHRALAPGLPGGVVLTAGELALLPNLAIWAAAVLAGPGVALGTGATVTVAYSALGPLPAIPALAALPAPGPMPDVTVALLALPLVAGVVAGSLILRGPAEGLLARLAVVGGAAGLCGVSAAALAWLSGGPAGPGRLADVGPQPLLTGAAFAAEVAVGATLMVLVTAAAPVLRERFPGRREPADDVAED